MASVDRTGVTGRNLDSYIRLLKDRFRARFGDDLTFEDETPQAQIVGVMAAALTENDEAIVQFGSSMSVDIASGIQLDDLGSLLGVQRQAATRSTVALTLTGVAGTAVPAGSRAQTADGVQWRTLADSVLTAGGVAAAAEAVRTGPVAAAAGAITSVVDRVPGWETVRNDAAAVVGRAEETDGVYRIRYEARTARNAAAPADALRAALVEAGAEAAVTVDENPRSTETIIGGYTLPGHSIMAIARDGTNADLSAAVQAAKGLGVGVLASIQGGSHSNVASIQGITAGTFSWRGIDLTGIDMSGDASYSAAAATMQAALRSSSDSRLQASSVRYRWPDHGNFALSYSWHMDENVDLPSGTAADALGLSSGTVSPGPFLRAKSRELTLAATVRRLPAFPADGLSRLRAAAIAAVDSLGNGVAPRVNQLIAAMEGVPGAAVTAMGITDKPAAIAADTVSVPVDGYYTLADSDIAITLA